MRSHVESVLPRNKDYRGCAVVGIYLIELIARARELCLLAEKEGRRRGVLRLPRSTVILRLPSACYSYILAERKKKALCWPLANRRRTLSGSQHSYIAGGRRTGCLLSGESKREAGRQSARSCPSFTAFWHPKRSQGLRAGITRRRL